MTLLPRYLPAAFPDLAPAHPVDSVTAGVVFGPPQLQFIRDETLADILEATAARLPHKVALMFGERSLTYQQLEQQAAQAASSLIAAGVRPGQIVGLWLQRGTDLLVMQAGIAKAGAAWLPFDADTPVERISACLADADTAGIVTCAEWAPRLADTHPPVWTAENLRIPSGPIRRREGITGEDPAYVIYTSGSTGRPKGIEVTQRSICHFLRSENAVLGVCESDRVYQGFSVAFDMSFEEIWISYLVGATLWIASKEVASDLELLPSVLTDNEITVLHAVPTSLALFARDVPCLRLINLGGEACPQSLVARWAKPGRRLFNTYGPTEATVSASIAELDAGEPVTIGRPLPNYGLMVIDPAVENGLRLLPRGEVGELCITGPGVAVGYLKRPELTAEKFVPNPWARGTDDARLYRTGDLARIDASDRVHCLGRTDDQVKIRGFRVELGEIEAALTGQSGINAAAVVLRQDDGIDQLVAFVVPESAAAISSASIRASLVESLPAYMIPGAFELLADMPRLTSGKVDRKALKARTLQPRVRDAKDSDQPETAAEEALFNAIANLFPGQPIVRSADFFDDLGGHSLFAARLASALRTDSRFSHITVRDIYQQRTVGAIARVLGESHRAGVTVDVEWSPPSSVKRWLCGGAQAAAVPGLVGLRMMQWLAPFVTYHFLTGDPEDSVARAIAASVGAFLLASILEFVVAIAGKWLIVGRLRAGRYPLWGLTYYRWWIVDRLLEAAPVYLISGSSLYAWWLRALGARVGRDVIIGSITLRVPDLLDIGDHASIGNAVNFENARVEHGELRIGPITIARDACIGSYAVMEGNTTVGAHGHVGGQSALAEGDIVPPLRIWTGSPARDVGAFDPASNPPRPSVSRAREIGEAIYFASGALLINTLFFLPVFPAFVLIDWFDDTERFPILDTPSVSFQLLKYFGLALPATAVLIICTVMLSAGIRWAVLAKLHPGSWPVHSNLYCAKWLVNQIQESSLNVLRGVYATVYSPIWYRLLGAKVGRDVEISSALGLVPDMLNLGDETFVGDAVMLGDEQIDGGWITLRPTVIAARTFVGNGAYVPDGTVLPENVLIGVHSSVPANDQISKGDTWLGSPPIKLPAREQTSGYPESLTYRPSPMRRLARGAIEAFRIIAPHAMVISVGYTIVFIVTPIAAAGRWREVVLYLTIAGLFYGVGAFLFTVALKWLCIGKYRKYSVAMWTPFVWLSEGVTNIYGSIAVPNFMRYLRGTPWLPVALNLLGCRIGKGVYMDTTDVDEFDCVTIGDYSELNALVSSQTHLFEDRVMKIDQVSIGARVYMGPRSVALYGSVVSDNARLGPLTLVMKGEFIPAATSWRGCPAERATV